MPYLADAVLKQNTWQLVFTDGTSPGTLRPLLVLSPILAQTLAKDGWSKQDVKQYLYDHCRMPAAVSSATSESGRIIRSTICATRSASIAHRKSSPKTGTRIEWYRSSSRRTTLWWRSAASAQDERDHFRPQRDPRLHRRAGDRVAERLGREITGGALEASLPEFELAPENQHNRAEGKCAGGVQLGFPATVFIAEAHELTRLHLRVNVADVADLEIPVLLGNDIGAAAERAVAAAPLVLLFLFLKGHVADARCHTVGAATAVRAKNLKSDPSTGIGAKSSAISSARQASKPLGVSPIALMCAAHAV